jgi:hypothetical protein
MEKSQENNMEWYLWILVGAFIYGVYLLSAISEQLGKVLDRLDKLTYYVKDTASNTESISRKT